MLRLLDFLIFYPMANFERKGAKEFTFGGPIDRAAVLAAITISSFLFAMLEIICAILFRVHILDIWYTFFLYLVGTILLARLLAYIYERKGRYAFLISDSFEPFTLSINLGVTICFLLLLLSGLAFIGCGLI